MAYIPFIPNQYFHIYNRGNNRENIFLEERNYYYFLDLYQKYISPVVFTLAFCLLPNHFHLLVRVKPQEECPDQTPLHRRFASMFIAYSKAVNKAYGRRGSLFEKHLKRKLVTNDRYFRTAVVYIHRNPQNHGLTSDFRNWPYSSFPALQENGNSFLDQHELFENFDGPRAFHSAHLLPVDEDYLPDSQW